MNAGGFKIFLHSSQGWLPYEQEEPFREIYRRVDRNTLLSLRANENQTVEREYRMFVNCSGQGSVDFVSYPFKSMMADGTISEAVASFGDPSATDLLHEFESAFLIDRKGRKSMRMGGVAIDGF